MKGGDEYGNSEARDVDVTVCVCGLRAAYGNPFRCSTGGERGGWRQAGSGDAGGIQAQDSVRLRRNRGGNPCRQSLNKGEGRARAPLVLSQAAVEKQYDCLC